MRFISEATRAGSGGEGRSLIGSAGIERKGAIDHDLIAGMKALMDLIAVADPFAKRHAPARKTAVALGDVNEGKVFVIAQNRRIGNKDACALLA